MAKKIYRATYTCCLDNGKTAVIYNSTECESIESMYERAAAYARFVVQSGCLPPETGPLPNAPIPVGKTKFTAVAFSIVSNRKRDLPAVYICTPDQVITRVELLPQESL